jgi:hypothetical protein
MSDAADLISAISDLLWPLIVLALLFIYRPQVVGALRRLRRLSFPGGSAEFDEELDRLDRTARAAHDGLPPVAPTPTRVARESAAEADQALPITPRGGAEESVADTKWMLTEAATSPKLALIGLSAEIERQARQILASSRDPAAWERGTLSHYLSRLELSPEVREAVEEFRKVRHEIVHGRGATDDDALRAIDSGLMILSAIGRVPRAVHIVYATDRPIYSDAEGRQVRPGVQGVVLESTSRPDPGPAERRVYPTTRTHFRPGKAVAWEWDLSRIWPESWYRNPDSGRLEYAWTESGEFIGRLLEEL